MIEIIEKAIHSEIGVSTTMAVLTFFVSLADEDRTFIIRTTIVENVKEESGFPFIMCLLAKIYKTPLQTRATMVAFAMTLHCRLIQFKIDSPTYVLHCCN